MTSSWRRSTRAFKIYPRRSTSWLKTNPSTRSSGSKVRSSRTLLFSTSGPRAELFIQERAHFRDRHRPLYFDTKRTNETSAKKTAFLKALIDTGRFRAVSTERIPAVIGDLLFGTVLSNHLAGRRVPPADQAQAILDVVIHGLLSDAERKAQARKKGVCKVATLYRRLIPVLLLGLCILSLFGCGPKPTAAATGDKPQDPVPVTVETLKPRSVQRTVTAVGTLGGYDEVTLAPKVDGRVLQVNFDIGDIAFPGAVLLSLDPADYKLAVNEAKRALDAELARLGWTAIPKGKPDVHAVPSVRKAAVTVEDAQRKLAQKEDLFKKSAGSVDELEIARTEFKLAEATHKQSVTEAETALASARWKQAALDSAIQRLADCELTVPIPAGYHAWAAVVGAGFTPARFMVAQRLITEGEMVRAMPVTNAFKLVIDFALKLHVQVPERFSADVKLGQKVDVRVDAYPETFFLGRVSRISPMVDAATRSFGVEIVVPNASGNLKCGGFARAAIHTKTDSTVLAVPPNAVVSFAGVTKIFVAVDGKAKAVPVTVGTRDKDWVEVVGDLKPGDAIITSGFSLVVDGSPIRIRD